MVKTYINVVISPNIPNCHFFFSIKLYLCIKSITIYMISVVIYLQTVCLLSGELNEPGSRSEPDVSLHVIHRTNIYLIMKYVKTTVFAQTY